MKGFAFHIERLQKSTDNLFSIDLNLNKVRSYLRQALNTQSKTSFSVRINIFTTNINLIDVCPDDIQILITLTEPVELDFFPFSVKTAEYDRILSKTRSHPFGIYNEIAVEQLKYKNIILELKNAILKSRFQAANLVNKELIGLYFSIGRKISDTATKEAWGSKVLEQISVELQNELPGLRGFSSGNLKKCGCLPIFGRST